MRHVRKDLQLMKNRNNTYYGNKKDNTREYFDGDKIKYGILKSYEKRPVSVEQIEEIVAFIENEINKHYISEIETEKLEKW